MRERQNPEARLKKLVDKARSFDNSLVMDLVASRK